MPYLMQAAFWVGVIGTVAALPLLVVLRFQNSYISASAFMLSSPAVLFFTAAFAFAAVYALLPSSRWRTRIAGMSAGVLTFFGFAIWMAIAVNVRTQVYQTPWPSFLFPFAAAFAVVGWIPIGGGWFAGWVVSKLPDAPAEEAP